MQKPRTSARVGKGSAASWLNASQPRRTIASAPSTSATRVNSSTSAPAMKPESLPERITIPRGRSCPSRSTIAVNSAMTSAEKVFVDAPALSKVTQTMPSASLSSRKWR